MARVRWSDTSGVSPVVGVILMVAIVVVLAAVLAAFVTGMGEFGSMSTAAVDVGADEDGYTVTVQSMGNSERVHVQCDGDVRAELSEVGSKASVSEPCAKLIITTEGETGRTTIKSLETSELNGGGEESATPEMQLDTSQWEPLAEGGGTHENEYRDDHVWQWLETTDGITGTKMAVWWVTADKQDLTDVDEIEVEWESPSGNENNNGGVRVEIVNNQTDKAPDIVHNTGAQFNFARTTETLDVSGYDGEYYIRLTTNARTSYGGEGSLKIYSITLNG